MKRNQLTLIKITNCVLPLLNQPFPYRNEQNKESCRCLVSKMHSSVRKKLWDYFTTFSFGLLTLLGMPSSVATSSSP